MYLICGSSSYYLTISRCKAGDCWLQTDQPRRKLKRAKSLDFTTNSAILYRVSNFNFVNREVTCFKFLCNYSYVFSII